MRLVNPRAVLRPLAILALLLAASPAWAQLGGTQFGGFAQEKPALSVSARFTSPTGDRPSYLVISASLDPGWHIYSITQAPGGPVTTKIKLAESDDYRRLGDFAADPPPKKKTEAVFGDLVVESHYDRVVWYAPIELRPGVDPGAVRIEGSVYAQPCTETSCERPRDFPFTATLGSAFDPPAPSRASAAPPPSAEETGRPQSPPGPAGRRLAWQPYTDLGSFAELISSDSGTFDTQKLRENVQQGFGNTSLLWQILLGFVGGIILNLMPCVLPVIGLKILSFVEQSGHDRRRGLLLNVWYSAGLIAVFLVLASLAVFLNFGWGHLFKFAGFSVTLAAIVFAMGLSFLGVWEIPIPGFVGSGKAVELAQKEGLGGAFAKGVLTTVLATPCTGPFMASALAWAASQPPVTTYVVFLSVGLGMASPYLLIGAFPNLIRFLPKPGAWMDTFKQIMGFVLMGTVVFIFTFMEPSYVVPTVGLLFAIWAACWWIARTPVTADRGTKARAWLGAAAFVAVCWIVLFPGFDGVSDSPFAFHGLHDEMRVRLESKIDVAVAGRFLELQQRQGSPDAADGEIRQVRLSGPRPVMVDFTADWCLTCKSLEAGVLNTPEVIGAVEELGVIPLKADWTHDAPEVTEFLDILGARQVPVLAIFSPRDPNNPVILRGGYTQRMVLDALAAAARGTQS